MVEKLKLHYNNLSSESSKDLEIARKVIADEINGLQALSQLTLNAEFIAAVNMIYTVQGRIIFSGMGKSGHIARKIAATFASTGTPAMFVHPAEASHGDLGMITPKDVLILFSNSGETTELKPLVYYAKRFNIALIAIVSKQESSLAEASDIALILPDKPEASFIEAPTTSTTMMLALGDALAIVLLEKRGFKREDFQVFHPGGKLGASFIKVKDIMYKGKDIPLITSDSIMSKALIVITEKRLGCVGVVNNKDELIGIITDGDLRRHMSQDLLNLSVKDVMTTHLITIDTNSLVVEALKCMNEKSITVLFVVDKLKQPIGVIHIHDCLNVGVK
ncbi:Arabinose 5-phosphate isomerase KdsD [Rickettsiales bacterium Ac37b]|nr:Arabinose 5-phosphate isomerase KdsD [Rickettsiales bacterium Ac37b]